MSALVHTPSLHEAPAQREAYSPRGHEQSRRHGFHRGNELRHDDRFLASVDVLLDEECEAEASAAQLLDISQSRHEYIGNHDRFGHVNNRFQNTHSNPPQLSGDADRRSYDKASYGSTFHTWDRAHAYQVVNGRRAA